MSLTTKPLTKVLSVMIISITLPPKRLQKDGKTIFDDSKIESHSALTPTYKIPKKSELSEKEYQVYQTIVHRFFAVFSNQDLIVSRSTIDIDLGGEEQFKLTGDVVLNKGWTVFEDREKKDKVLPNLKIGDEVILDLAPIQTNEKIRREYI